MLRSSIYARFNKIQNVEKKRFQRFYQHTLIELRVSDGFYLYMPLYRDLRHFIFMETSPSCGGTAHYTAYLAASIAYISACVIVRSIAVR